MTKQATRPVTKAKSIGTKQMVANNAPKVDVRPTTAAASTLSQELAVALTAAQHIKNRVLGLAEMLDEKLYSNVSAEGRDVAGLEGQCLTEQLRFLLQEQKSTHEALDTLECLVNAL